jgi:hypothetical protein
VGMIDRLVYLCGPEPAIDVDSLLSQPSFPCPRHARSILEKASTGPTGSPPPKAGEFWSAKDMRGGPGPPVNCRFVPKERSAHSASEIAPASRLHSRPRTSIVA